MGHVLELCRTGGLSVNRAALLRGGLALADVEAPSELANILNGHPIETIIHAAHSETVWADAEWTQFCEAHPEVREWMDAIQASADINAVLRLSLYELFDQRIESSFPRHDLRADELPESLGVINVRTMSGGE